MRVSLRRCTALVALVAISAVDVAAALAYALHHGLALDATRAWMVSIAASVVMLPLITRWMRRLAASAETDEVVTIPGKTIP